MLPEERALLQKTAALAEENNKILRALKRSMVWARVTRFIYWAIIIGSAVGAYYFVEPYIDQVLGVYGSAKNNLENVNSLFENFKN